MLEKSKTSANLKRGQATGRPNVLQPICLLDNMGKLMEKMLLRRLNEELEKTGGLSEQQFGFRKGKSTVDALIEIRNMAEHAKSGTHRTREWCMLVTLDV